MAIRRLLKLIDLDALTDAQKREIRKILSDRQWEFESDLKTIDRALAKKRKTKRTTKKR